MKDQLLDSAVSNAALNVQELLRDERLVQSTKTLQAMVAEADPDGVLGIGGPQIMQALLQFGIFGGGQAVVENAIKMMSADRNTTFQNVLDFAVNASSQGVKGDS